MTEHVLMVGSTASMIKQFNQRNIKLLQEQGYSVIVAANFAQPGTISEEAAVDLRESLENQGVTVVNISFGRGMGSLRGNIVALKELNLIFKEYKITFVHVHSALASILTRVVALLKGVPVLYTVHGFQFTKNGSRLRWLAFFPVEWAFSFITKRFIVINDEDEKIITKMFWSKSKVSRINGVGIELEKFKPLTLDKKAKLREKLHLSNETKIFLTVAELSARKNQEFVIRNLARVASQKWQYILVGNGSAEKQLRALAINLGISDRVVFLGYREDVADFFGIADYGIYMSKLEGLLTAGMESLASGVPLIGSDVRGIKDLISDEHNGYLITPPYEDNFIRILNEVLVQDDSEYEGMRLNSVKSAKGYDKRLIDAQMLGIYQDFREEITGGK